MIKKLFRIALILVVLWAIGTLVYFLAAESKVRTMLNPALGKGYEIKLELFDDLFLEAESRRSVVTITDKQSELRQVSIPITASGRFFPSEINLGNLTPLHNIADKETIDQIGKKSAHQRARDGISDAVLDD